MSAKVKNNPLGGSIGYCADCNATLAGPAFMVDLWADAHNDVNHSEPQP